MIRKNEPGFVVLDGYNNPIAVMDNFLSEAIHYSNEVFHTYLTGSAYTFSFDVSKVVHGWQGTSGVEHLVVGNKISFEWKGCDYFLTIVELDEDEFALSVFCFGLSLELVNEHMIAFESLEPLHFADYLAAFDGEGMLTLGTNEVSDKSLALSWDSSEDTALSRIYSLADNFEAEIGFSVELNQDFSLAKIKVDVYKKHDDVNQGLGERRNDVVMEYGKTVDSIRRKTSILGLYTCITPVGDDDLSIADIVIGEKDSQGVTEFYSPLGDANIYAVKAKDKYPSQLIRPQASGYVRFYHDVATNDAKVLADFGLKKLKEVCVPQFEYEISGYNDLNIGDSVVVSDLQYSPPLYIDVRVLEQEICWSDKTKCKTVYGNFMSVDVPTLNRLTKPIDDVAQDKDFEVTHYVGVNGGTIYHYVGSNVNVIIPEYIYGELVTTYEEMFSRGYVESVSAPYASNVNCVLNMFEHHKSASGKLELLGLNTVNVTDFSYMFSHCKSEIVGIGTLKTENAVRMTGMFNYYEGVTLSIGELNTAKVEYMDSIFAYCKCGTLDIQGLNTVKVKTYKDAFRGSVVDKVIWGTFVNPVLESVESMFQYAVIKDIDFKTLQSTALLTNVTNMFNESNLPRIELTTLVTTGVTSFEKMFMGCKCQYIDISMLDTSNATTMKWMFYKLQGYYLNVRFIDTSKVSTMESMFEGSDVHAVDTKYFVTDSVVTFKNMFKDSTTGFVDASNFYTPLTKDFTGMFENCGGIQIMDLRRVDTSNVEHYDRMFKNTCIYYWYGLEKFKISAYYDSLRLGIYKPSMTEMFYACYAPELDISGFKFEPYEVQPGWLEYCNVTDMFKEARGLSVTVGAGQKQYIEGRLGTIPPLLKILESTTIPN